MSWIIRRCAECGTPYELSDEPPDEPRTDWRCTVCGGKTLSQNDEQVIREETRGQLAGQVLCLLRLKSKPWGLIAPSWEGPVCLGVVLGQVDDWAVYCAPESWMDQIDEDAFLAKLAHDGQKIDRSLAVELFPFMNPTRYRE